MTIITLSKVDSGFSVNTSLAYQADMVYLCLQCLLKSFGDQESFCKSFKILLCIEHALTLNL